MRWRGKPIKKNDRESIPVAHKIIYGTHADKHRFSNYETTGKYIDSTVIYLTVIGAVEENG